MCRNSDDIVTLLKHTNCQAVLGIADGCAKVLSHFPILSLSTDCITFSSAREPTGRHLARAWGQDEKQYHQIVHQDCTLGSPWNSGMQTCHVSNCNCNQHSIKLCLRFNLQLLGRYEVAQIIEIYTSIHFDFLCRHLVIISVTFKLSINYHPQASLM